MGTYRTPEELQETFARGIRKAVAGIAIIAMTIVGGCGMFGMFEQVDADKILVVQDAWDGDLHFYTTPGTKPQYYGRTTEYTKRSLFKFEAPVTFNDGGKGVIKGSVQYELPLDENNLREVHTKYRSDTAVQDLMASVTKKVIYMTGPTMSSRESYAEKRNFLINYAQDQIDNGVYATRRAQREEVDQFTGQKKIVVGAEIVTGTDGRPVRQEKSVVAEFGIRAFNFAIEQIDYDETVDKQIADQQRITMEVQTSIANAVKAQQQAITVEQQGRADSAKAKWDQEVIKAKAVTAAEQALAVQELAVKTAEAYKQEQLLRADADAKAKKMLLDADGALAPKLATYERVNQMWAEAFAKNGGSLVPSVVLGGSGNTNGLSASQTFMDLMIAKTAKELGVSVVPNGKAGGSQ